MVGTPGGHGFAARVASSVRSRATPRHPAHPAHGEPSHDRIRPPLHRRPHARRRAARRGYVRGGLIVAIILAPIGAILSWLLWSAITYVVGDKLLGGTATWGELLRTLGFAQAPGVLLIFGIIPILGGLVRMVVAAWMLFTGVVAIRQALDFSTGKAIAWAAARGILIVPVESPLSGT